MRNTHLFSCSKHFQSSSHQTRQTGLQRECLCCPLLLFIRPIRIQYLTQLQKTKTSQQGVFKLHFHTMNFPHLLPEPDPVCDQAGGGAGTICAELVKAFNLSEDILIYTDLMMLHKVWKYKDLYNMYAWTLVCVLMQWVGTEPSLMLLATSAVLLCYGNMFVSVRKGLNGMHILNMFKC